MKSQQVFKNILLGIPGSARREFIRQNKPGGQADLLIAQPPEI
jgi:hypothetical protein